MSVPSILAVASVCLLLGGFAGWSAAVSRLGARLRSAQVRVAQAEARLDAERAAAADRVQALQADQTRLSDQFRVLAADALASNNEQFLALAHQRLAASQQSQVAELGRSEAAVRQLVEPLLASRRQHQAVAALRQLARELDPQASRRASDERDFLHLHGSFETRPSTSLSPLLRMSGKGESRSS